MNALTTLAKSMIAGRGLVALALCPILLAGCAGAGLQSSGLAGPSWQQREALYFQEEDEEEGDLGDRLGEAEEEGDRKTSRRRHGRSLFATLGVLVGVAGILAALEGLSDDEDEDLTFDAPSLLGSTDDEAARPYSKPNQWRGPQRQPTP